MVSYVDYPMVGVDYDYEKFESLLVTSLISHGDVCIDIGANVGHYTILMGLYSGSAGRVISVEPDPYCLVKLRQNVWANGLKNVEIMCAAVSDHEEIAPLYLDTGGGKDNRLQVSPGEMRSTILVYITSLNKIVSATKRVSFVKIDVQGYETKVIRGGKESLKNNENVGLLVECCPDDLKRVGDSSASLIGEIQECGFEVFYIPNENIQKLFFIAPGKCLHPRYYGLVCNLLCVKGNKRNFPDWMESMVEKN